MFQTDFFLHLILSLYRRPVLLVLGSKLLHKYTVQLGSRIIKLDVRCILKSNRMFISFWNHQTFYFKDCWVLVRNSWSVCWILSLFAIHQGGFWVELSVYWKLKRSTLFRFYKYFTNDFYTKYLQIAFLNLSNIYLKNWQLLFPAEGLNLKKYAKF